eukprot:GEMP01040830.1.p1 GENE.GEMP01040830.1~~GEMP01040830.1.p1  ORF type:complete len:372 (+),score=55.98 GEMP01040830.1:90-1205(+)
MASSRSSGRESVGNRPQFLNAYSCAPELQIQSPITAHAIDDPWLVLGLETGNLLVYNLRSEPPQKVAELEGHLGYVSGVDIAGGRIVSVAHDRTVFVWEHTEGSTEWTKHIVHLRNSHALLSVMWDQSGLRFCAGVSGSNHTIICSRKPTETEWTTRKSVNHSGPVTTVCWSSLGYLASGGQDGRVIVHASRKTDADDDNMDDDAEQALLTKTTVDVSLGAWVNCVRFSPNGKICAAVSMDSCVTMLHLDGPSLVKRNSISCESLPFATLCFLNDRRLICAGWGFEPMLFYCRKNDNPSGIKWSGALAIRAEPTPTRAGATHGEQKSHGRAHLRHENTITHCRRFTRDRFSTSGLDGRWMVWSIGGWSPRA